MAKGPHESFLEVDEDLAFNYKLFYPFLFYHACTKEYLLYCTLSNLPFCDFVIIMGRQPGRNEALDHLVGHCFRVCFASLQFGVYYVPPFISEGCGSSIVTCMGLTTSSFAVIRNIVILFLSKYNDLVTSLIP